MNSLQVSEWAFKFGVIVFQNKAIQNKLYGLSQDFFQKERASEAKKRARKKKTQQFIWTIQ